MAARKKIVRAAPSASGAGFIVWFRHPHLGKPIKASCQTSDQAVADLIAAHLTVFVNAPADYPLTDEAFRAAAGTFNARAIEIWFGRPSDRLPVTPWGEVVASLTRQYPAAREHFDSYAQFQQEIPILRTRVQELEAEIARLRRQCGVHARVALRAAVDAWALEYPTGHGSRTVREATKVVRDFCAWAEEQRGKKVFVGQIRRGDVAKWLAVVRSSRPASAEPPQGGGGAVAHNGTPHARARERLAKPHRAHATHSGLVYQIPCDISPVPDTAQMSSTGGQDARAPLSPVTRKKFRAYLSTFFSWARDRYDLPENPAREIDVPGVSRSAEDIQAIRRYEDLVEIATALRDWPYWRTLWLTAVLAGPRWDELRRMRIADVGLQARTLTIRAPKTGRQRSTPIESTMLLPALRAHLERRARERQGEDVDLPLFGGPGDGAQPETIRAAARSDLLFPSYVDEGTRPRTKTEPGLWSDSSTFLRAWRRAIKAAWRQQSNGGEWKKSPPAWRFQPREWRHSAGSAMGHCGCSSLQISQWIGNSEAIARRHYIPPVSGQSWPLNYGG